MSSTLGRLVAVEAIRSDLAPPGASGRTVEIGFLPLLGAVALWIGEQLAIWWAFDKVTDLILPGDEEKHAAGPMPTWGQRAILRTAVVSRMLKASNLTGERAARLNLMAKATDKLLAEPATTLYMGEMALRQMDYGIQMLQALEFSGSPVPAPGSGATVSPAGVVSLPTFGAKWGGWPWLIGGVALVGLGVWYFTSKRGRR